jgi:hypothetical protein
VADFIDLVASGVLTADVAAEVERLRAQHADAIREKSTAESKKPQAGGESDCLGGREDRPPAPAGGGEEGGEPGHLLGAGGGQSGAGGGKSRRPTRRGVGGKVQRPARPRGQGRGLYALGGLADARTVRGLVP